MNINLSENFNDFEQKELAPENESFVVDSDSKANWALRKIAEHQANIANIRAFVASEIERLEDYENAMTDPEQSNIDWLEQLLRPYAAKQLEGQKTKTYKLPCGKCSFKKDTVTITRDENALLAFCKANAPDYVKVKESVDWAGYKKQCTIDDGKMITPDGEIVAGVTVQPEGPDIFKVEVSKDGL